MSTEGEVNMSSAPALFDNVNWQTCRDALKQLYQRAPYLPNNSWEFTPRDGITHARGCQHCTYHKEHLIVGKMLGEEQGSSAWKIQERYKKDLIQVGWTLALEAGRLGQGAAAAIESLEQRNYYLNTIAETAMQLKDNALAQCNELQEELACKHLDAELRGREANFWQREFEITQKAYSELQQQLIDSCNSIASWLRDEDIHIGSMTTEDNLPGRAHQPEHVLVLTESVGVLPQDEPMTHHQHQQEASVSQSDHTKVTCIAAARNEATTPHERKFRVAQSHKGDNGIRPQTSGNNHRCMAALVKINSLEAYALLDSRSTTMSITHDFTRVAKLKVMQLENPVPLQLGTVGSRSMINFGTQAHLELGTIIENDAYLDIVNIDQYNMIISTPFMCKHGLVLDFKQNVLSIQDNIIDTLTTGQEDLMLAKQ